MIRTARQTRPLAMTTKALLSLCGLGVLATASQALPPIVDRVPTDAMVSITIPNIENFQKDMEALGTLVGVPVDVGMKQMLMMAGGEKGLNTKGAITMIVMQKEKADSPEEPPVIILVPTNDFGALVGNFGGKAGDGVTELTMPDGDKGFAKSIDGGFAAVGNQKDAVEKFTGKAGNLTAHKTAIGAAGDKLADSGDLIIIVNMPVVRPLIEKGIEEGMKEMEANMAMLGAAGGEGADPAKSMEAGKFMVQQFIKDSKGLVFVTTIDGLGVSFDIAANFTEGSRMAKVAAKGGNAGNFLKKLPAGPYLFAGAFDSAASPEAIAFFKEMQEKMGDQAKNNALGAAWGKNMDKVQGQAITIGVPPGGIMSGLLSNTTSYVGTKDPAAFVGAMKDTIKEMTDAKTGTGKYDEGAVDVNGTKVDSWEMHLAADPNNPMAAQGMMVMFGPAGGPNGYTAKVDGGVVQTFAKSSPLMSGALKAAAGTGDSLGSDKLTQQVADKMPKGRLAEGYIGIKGILDSVLPFAAMAGFPIKADIPETLPPVGMGLSADGGVQTMSVYIPNPVIKTIADLVKNAQENMGGMGGPGGPAGGPPEEGGQPKF